VRHGSRANSGPADPEFFVKNPPGLATCASFGADRDSESPLLWKEPGMLVLSRQRDETIIIGDNIEITVVDIRGDKVRLGVSAPKEISVHRKEVYEAIRRENREAAQVKPEDLSALGKLKPQGPKGPEKK
jgi:carbon storage regulator